MGEFRFDPLIYYARRLAGFACSGRTVASDIVTVCPEETGVRPKAFYLEDQLDRVRSAVESPGGLELQLARISETPVTHAATRALCFRNAALLKGYLFAGGSRRQLTMEKPPVVPRLVADRIETASLVGTPASDVFFGHYLMDDSATALLAREFGPVRSVKSLKRESWTHAAEYRSRMRISAPEVDDAFISEAWLFEDIGMNSNRRDRMNAVRKSLSFSRCEGAGHAVFILRSSFGQDLRLLENELEIADVLANSGFTVCNPMLESVDEIVGKVGGASIVVSVEGSALTHAYLTMQDNGAIVTIQPPYRFDNVWKDFTDLIGMKYAFVVGEGDRHRFRLEPADLMRTIDLVS